MNPKSANQVKRRIAFLKRKGIPYSYVNQGESDFLDAAAADPCRCLSRYGIDVQENEAGWLANGIQFKWSPGSS